MTALAQHQQETMSDLDAFVWLGFHRDTSLHFRVTLPRDKAAARTTLNAAGCYNRFDPDEAYAIVDGWSEYLMRVELAREGSVALYLTFPWYQHQAIGAGSAVGAWLNRDNIPVPTETARVFAAQLAAELTDIGADETTYDPQTRTLRARWD